jgi:hypothetical protein
MYGRKKRIVKTRAMERRSELLRVEGLDRLETDAAGLDEEGSIGTAALVVFLARGCSKPSSSTRLKLCGTAAEKTAAAAASVACF